MSNREPKLKIDEELAPIPDGDNWRAVADEGLEELFLELSARRRLTRRFIWESIQHAYDKGRIDQRDATDPDEYFDRTEDATPE